MANSPFVTVNGAKVVNLTPHTINVIGKDGEQVASFEPSGLVARASQTAEVIGSINGVELCSMKFGAPENLPKIEEGTFYIVSAIMATSIKEAGLDASKFLITADPVRDEQGRIRGCGRFALI